MTHPPAEPRDEMNTSALPDPSASPVVVAASDSPLAPPAAAHPPSKFTVLLDPDATIKFDQLALDIRRLLGRRVSKGDLVRALITLAAADPTLRTQLIDRLRTHSAA